MVVDDDILPTRRGRRAVFWCFIGDEIDCESEDWEWEEDGEQGGDVGEEEQPVITTTQECEDRTSKTSSPADKRASRRKSIIAPPAADCLQ